MKRGLPLRGALLAGWGLYVVFWALLSLRGPGVSPRAALALNLWLLVPTMLTTLAVPALARRLRIVPGRIGAGLTIHCALACTFAATQAAVRWQLMIFQPPMTPFGLFGFRSFVRDAIAYLLVAAIVHARDFLHLWREQEVRTARARADLARAGVDALCWRVQPGVILAALERVDQALGQDPESAEAALARLGALLRLLLQEPERQMVSLAHELAVLRAAVELIAPGGTLHARVGADASAAALPRLLLLTLAHRTLTNGRCRLRVVARREGDVLSLSVFAQPPLDEPDLDAARARLEAAWPARARQDVRPGGVQFLLPAAVA
jgi:hypothetical protein